MVPREENFASLYDKTRQVLHTEIFLIHRKLRPMNQKALRAGSHCGGVELCRWGDPPQAENPAKQDSFL
ncbi:hypothetical protein DXA60_14490 [Roseburia sp. OF03-24]|nr:hypothetical protein DXA60_14490 [Roseburia sp. OF03-24]